ncbi:hypothetical protein [Pseudomonas sp. UBA6562]|uniref:hypothetical protein n=1 Tax=Pseudomonas sp. UBA6562 TaxID=1947332 RepID=UPI0025DE030E|nr:hypothetical protein [Pseudomonas sp. UBA6562]
MAKFIESFNQGIHAADLAARNLEEIGSVISQLSDEVEIASSGKIKIEITQQNEPINRFTFQIEDAFDGTRYEALTAFNPVQPEHQEELARWKVSDSGYPCRIEFPDSEVFCEDRVSLENALAKLIATPAVGKKLKHLIESTTQTPDV